MPLVQISGDGKRQGAGPRPAGTAFSVCFRIIWTLIGLWAALSPAGPLAAQDAAPADIDTAQVEQRSNRPPLYDDPATIGPPAWAQGPPDNSAAFLQPFGSNLFSGNFSKSYYDGLSPTYLIKPGDRVVVRMWGAKSFDDVLAVDQQGNLFLPEIGPVPVDGLTQTQLLAAVRDKLSTVFTGNVEVYVNLMNAQPVAVYVTGFVDKPGRYAGGPTDSPLYYMDLAGGINIHQGSYRQVEIRRGNSTLAVLDLYDFILNGNLPNVRLRDGDSIVVRKKGLTVAAAGRLPHPGLYELKADENQGAHLMALASPLNSVSHVSLSGVRQQAPFRTYMTVEDFRGFRLNDNDTVEFHANRQSDVIMVNASGAVLDGSARYPVRRGATLSALLRYVAVDEELANWPAVYLRRQTVAAQQKKSIMDALRRLEQSTLTATSASVEESAIRVQEAKLVQDFIKRAAAIQPNGVVVVSHRGQLNDLPLEDGDTIVIPQKTSVVLVTGEVMLPNSVAYSSKMSLTDYITGAGGFTDRADKGNILVVKPNGEVGPAKTLGLGPGDNLMVMPAYDSKDMQIFKDLTQVIYQIAIAAGVAIGL
ncbi:MAG: polysaccharide biosynthesis/export family protein [Candidatus Adiutrix sp.]|jgi:protein involved in polysaccharide export with SLBB domain|nr:polysaccharide biosynthesis/export family protein [Candidatus Adiutrix sp.]